MFIFLVVTLTIQYSPFLILGRFGSAGTQHPFCPWTLRVLYKVMRADDLGLGASVHCDSAFIKVLRLYRS